METYLDFQTFSAGTKIRHDNLTSKIEPCSERVKYLYRPQTHNIGIQMKRNKLIYDDFKLKKSLLCLWFIFPCFNVVWLSNNTYCIMAVMQQAYTYSLLILFCLRPHTEMSCQPPVDKYALDYILLARVCAWTAVWLKQFSIGHCVACCHWKVCNSCLIKTVQRCSLCGVLLLKRVYRRKFSRRAFCKLANYKRTTIGWKGERGNVTSAHLHNIARSIAVSSGRGGGGWGGAVGWVAV